ncbi:MAG: monofunctional biosynthetic peptidoglycan transglycosylase [Pseudomonadota bacterium]
MVSQFDLIGYDKPMAPAKKKTAKRKIPTISPRWKRIFLRASLVIIGIFFLLPFALLLLYKIEAVHPVSTIMLRESLFGAGAKREWVEFEDVAPVLYQSVMMSEDGQFCSHNGVDWSALNQVIEDAIDGEKTRGASTITMQLVKNLFLWPERSYIRKGLEVPYAMMADIILSKRRIMEIYLNVAEWDIGIFGIEKASQHYFKRPAVKLGPRYSSLLAVTLPNPKARNPAKPSRRLTALAATVRKRARASGAYIKCLLNE